jgi:4-amino-4-deoxy-L-arabinose transferase-like glycosyltransferase
MNQQSTASIPAIDLIVVAVLLALLLIGIAYAWLVRRLRQRYPRHGYTAFLVVVGDLIVVGGYAVLAGMHAASLLLLCMAAAGLPMVVEYVEDHLASTAATERRLDI